MRRPLDRRRVLADGLLGLGVVDRLTAADRAARCLHGIDQRLHRLRHRSVLNWHLDEDVLS
jgi:hypothetical protein